MLIGEVAVAKGDMIKIDGERGKFMFLYHVTNNDNGVEWIDTIEMMRGGDGPWRSFKPGRARIMKGRKRG